MDACVSVAGGLVKASVTVTDKQAGIVLIFVGAGLFVVGLVMLSKKPNESFGSTG